MEVSGGEEKWFGVSTETSGPQDWSHLLSSQFHCVDDYSGKFLPPPPISDPQEGSCWSRPAELKLFAFLAWQVKAAIKYALSVGYRHIDCAAVYGNESEIGEALKENVGPGKVRTGYRGVG